MAEFGDKTGIRASVILQVERQQRADIAQIEGAFLETWLPVVFERGEPLCMLVPQRRHDIERVRPAFRSLEADPALERRVRGWANSREEFLVDLAADDTDARTRRWQKDYFQGHDVDGSKAEVHQTKLRVREFVDER